MALLRIRNVEPPEVPTPDYDTQLKVADEIAFAVSAAKGIASAAHRELAAVNALPKALIDRAFISKP